MRAPDFWYRDPARPGAGARLLAPLGWVYAALTAARVRRLPQGYRAGVPVISVGNINAGGTGKTPTVIALAQRLRAAGVEAHVVSRGHGGQLVGPVRVDERGHSAAEVGDEPLLIAAFAPIWVAKDRAAGVRAAEAAGAGVIILDDALQNPAVARDLDIVVVDAAKGFGNGRCIPAGPLREPVDAGLQRADLLISVGPARAQALFAQAWAGRIPRGVTHLPAALRPLATGMPWKGLRVLAFAGIGHPEKFFATLRAEGADVIRGEALGDHQPLTEALMTRLQTEANLRQAQLVTTEKDAVRLPDKFRPLVLTMPVRLEPEDWGPLDAAMEKAGITPRQ